MCSKPLLASTVALSLLAVGCTPADESVVVEEASAMNALAERYVELVLATGEHDEGYVDAYYGPPEWRDEIHAAPPPLEQIERDAADVLARLEAIPDSGDLVELLRLRWLRRQTAAVIARLEMLGGRTLSFDEESRALYDAVAPRLPEEHFAALVAELDRALPGEGSVAARLDAFRRGFIIPAERLDAVFQAAIEGCRERTGVHLALPEGESFRLEYVTDKPWSGYNWYQGDYQSLIQINTDLPTYLDRAIDLACHEGYPGHHVYNVLLEQHLTRDRGWVEFSVYPLYSPQSLIAEGTANYGIEVAFPGDQRLAFERDVLFPLAGLDPAQAETYRRVEDLAGRLSFAGNEAARGVLDGTMNAEQASDWLTRYALMAPDRARQRLSFIDTYRSYVINYNFGRDLVARWVEAQAGDAPEATWRVFGQLLSTPRLPSGLATE